MYAVGNDAESVMIRPTRKGPPHDFHTPIRRSRRTFTHVDETPEVDLLSAEDELQATVADSEPAPVYADAK